MAGLIRLNIVSSWMMERYLTMEGKMSWLDFYKDKTVLVTGHTGFKGSWLCVMLEMAGAKVVGYALPPKEDDVLFEYSKAEEEMISIEGDIRDREHLQEVFNLYKPQIVFHLAAQPIVRTSYEQPVYTYETNVMGTVNLLECVRLTSEVCSVLNVTTDKVYENKEWEWGYRENDSLDGYDPYSNSKSCSELVTHSYKKAFLEKNGIAVSTARAGNVIGGGDFSRDRIIPDCVRAALKGEEIIIRNPYSIRPFQHVLEPLTAYMKIAAMQALDEKKADYYNVGPDDVDCVNVGTLADLFCKAWGNGITWKNVCEDGPHEAKFLKLDCSHIKQTLGWKPCWNISTAIGKTIEWTKVYSEHGNIRNCMEAQINEFWKRAKVI